MVWKIRGKEWKKMMVLIARFFIVSIAYGMALLIAVMQLLFVGLCFLLGLAFILIAFPLFAIKQVFFK
jgi:hypothetical protein